MESRLKPLMEQNEQLAHQIQKVKQSTIIEIENSRNESDQQIQILNKAL